MEKEREFGEFENEIEEEFFYENSPLNNYLDFLKQEQLRKRTYVYNPIRYKEFLYSLKAVTNMIRANDSNAEIQVSHFYDVDPTSFGIVIKTDDILIGETSMFMDAVQFSDNFEIHPLLNGKISMSIGFENVMIEAPVED